MLRFLIETLTFVFVGLAALWAMQSFQAASRVRRRLGKTEEAAKEPATSESVLRSNEVKGGFLKWIQQSTSLKDFKDRVKIGRDLSLAGFEHPAAPIWYVIIRLAMAIGLPALYLVSIPLFHIPIKGLTPVYVTILLCGIGLVGPRAFIDHRIQARREEMEHEFPDALDLMVVCVEAGLGVESAFVKVGEVVKESHPRTSFEFGRLAREMSAGRVPADALRAMADRVSVETIRSFVALIIQSETLGVSIGQALRTYAAEMRERRFLKAEEKAARVPVLMTLPLVICFLPVIVAALLLPAFIDIARTVLPSLRGQN